MSASKALSNLRKCVGFPESLLVNAIHTIILCWLIYMCHSKIELIVYILDSQFLQLFENCLRDIYFIVGLFIVVNLFSAESLPKILYSGIIL